MGVTPPSTCPWLDHPVSGLMHATRRPIQTRFRYASTYRLKLAAHTKSLTHYTKGTPSPRLIKSRRDLLRCRSSLFDVPQTPGACSARLASPLAGARRRSRGGLRVHGRAPRIIVPLPGSMNPEPVATATARQRWRGSQARGRARPALEGQLKTQTGGNPPNRSAI